MSQKADSLLWIEENIAKHALPTVVFPHHKEHDYDVMPEEYPLFVRTCPLNAQPGAFDSMRVDSQEELKLSLGWLSNQMHSSGENQGTIAVQPFCPSIANIVWAPGLMVIGPGHDGVTAGREPVIMVNAPAPQFYNQAVTDMDLSGAEIEMVVDANDRVWVTQVRQAIGHFSIAAPPLQSIPGFLHRSPLKISDCNILNMHSLADIGALCRLEPNKDVIVSHPTGSALSHAAAWCRKNGHSYIVSDISKHMATLSDPDRDGWLHEPSRGWLVSGADNLDQQSVTIDNFRGTFYRSIEHGLNRCSLQDLRSRWVTILPFSVYSNDRGISREVAELAGLFVGTLLRSVMVGMNEFIRCALLSKCGTVLRDTQREPGFGGTLNVGSLDIKEYLTAFRKTFIDKQQLWIPPLGDLKRWYDMADRALNLFAAFESRDWALTVASTNSLIESVKSLEWAFAYIIGQDHLFLPEANPAVEWQRTALAWARCLFILQGLREPRFQPQTQFSPALQ